MLWFKLPEVAVTVALYVPAGVLGVVCEDELPPPQATKDANVKTMIDAARVGRRRGMSTPNSPAANQSTLQAKASHRSGEPG